jgi:ubiquinone/menaquinone biosynthesis C-methylase UbiE
MTDLRKESITDDELIHIQMKLRQRSTKNSLKISWGEVKFVAADVEELPFKSESFDRVISTCLFHHLGNPLKGFEELRSVTRKGQTISILIPNDPGMMYRFLTGVTS